MATPILLPELGPDAGQKRISCWLVDPGESLDVGDRVVEILLAGMTFDVAAPVAGVLTRIEKSLDAPVETSDVLGWIDENDET